MKFKTGDIVVLDEPMLELVLITGIDKDFYQLTLLDTERVPYVKPGKDCCWLTNYVDKVGYIVTNEPAKCICPIRDLCSIGCKCGGI